MPTHTELANFIWLADLLGVDYKQSEYGKVILPFTVLRRLDCVMAPTREAVWAKDGAVKGENRDAILYRAAGGLQFYNLSRQDFATIGADPANVTRNLVDYYNGFSATSGRRFPPRTGPPTPPTSAAEAGRSAFRHVTERRTRHNSCTQR